MFDTARITTLGTQPGLVAWIRGVSGYKYVINPEKAKPGEDRIVMFAPEMKFCVVVESCNLLYIEEKIAYVILEKEEPKEIRFNREEAKEIAQQLQAKNGNDYSIKGIALQGHG